MNVDEGVPITALREMTILKKINHPNVVRLIEIIQGNFSIYLVFEYLACDLFAFQAQQPDGVSLLQIKKITYHSLNGLYACQINRILHRDMKPANILLNDEDTVKICDFGLAKCVDIPFKEMTLEIITLWYRPPEVLLGLKEYSSVVDSWSLGLILLEMLIRRVPLQGNSEIDQLFKIFGMFGTPNRNNWAEASKLPFFSKQFPRWTGEVFSNIICDFEDDLKELLTGMLTLDPEKRFTVEECLEAKWFEELK